MFHRFHRSGQAPTGQGSMTGEDFERILLEAGTTNIVSPDQWLARAKERALDRRDLCVTFDDGLRSQRDVALPVLERHGIQAFWFVYSAVFEGGVDRNEVYNFFAVRFYPRFEGYVDDVLAHCEPAVRRALDGADYRSFASELRAKAPFYGEADLRYRFIRNRVLSRREFESVVDRVIAARGQSVEALAQTLWLTNDDLRRLSDAGHRVGLHSYDHPFELARLSPGEQRSQFERNRAHVEKATGRAVRCMSHPLNSYDERTLAILEEMGIECGFRANMAPPDGKPLNPGPLEFAREDGTNLLRKGPP